MPDIEYLRQAMRAETSDLRVHVPIEKIRRRATSVRRMRTAGFAAVIVLVALAIAIPGLAVLDRARPASDLPAGSFLPPSPTPCPTSAQDLEVLGSVVESGVSIEGPDHERYDVVAELIGDPNDPNFTIGFRDHRTGYVEPWDMVGISRGHDGNFTAKGETWQFESGQLPLDAGHVLDIGIYSRSAHRITVASEGRSSDTHIATNEATGMTFFWVERTGRPLPADANAGPREYQGPERLTITAYDAAGQVRHSVVGGFHTGNRIQNPRDNAADPQGTPTPGVPC